MENAVTPVTNATRPAANRISFERRCFAKTGEVVVSWVVGPNPGSTAYPESFSDEQAAREFGARKNRPVSRQESEREVRISWT